MPVHLITHESSWRHVTPAGHPERVERVTAVTGAIRASSHEVVEHEAPSVDMGLLEEIHDRSYIEHIREFCRSGGGALDADTRVVPASWEAATRAAGAGPHAIDTLRSESGTAFVAVRPPGHHAERDRAMGFCVFNNVAITASYLLSKGERVAIVDWDVHHGNGTQRSFSTHADVLYVSMHEFPFYPGSGWVDEVGEGPGMGTTVNVPLPPGTSASSQLAAFDRIVVPVVTQFAPDWLLVSAGYDAHVRDPLGSLNLESDHYGWMASALGRIVPGDRVVAFLEGGYDLTALREASVSTVDGLSGERPAPVWPTAIEGRAAATVDLAIEQASRFWKIR